MKKVFRWYVVSVLVMTGVVPLMHGADAPLQQNMRAAGGEQSLVGRPRDDEREYCCRSCVVCAEYLERHRDRFPDSWIVGYGKCCARCCCIITDEAFEEIHAASDSYGESAHQTECGAFCTRGVCGYPEDYHCTGRIVMNHCCICLFLGLGTVIGVVFCVKC